MVPYLIEIKCDKCKKGRIVFDYDITLNNLLINVDFHNDLIKYIQDKWVSSVLYYKCDNCGNVVEYTFKEIEEKARESVARDVMNIRKQSMFRTINPKTINPDNGLEFCGICDGIDGEGNCYSDIVKQCTIKHGS